MFDVIGRKSLETSVLSAILFYVFANPSTYKMVNKIPGFKFVMKSTTEITHSGVLAHALIFGVVFLGCVWLINNTMLNQYFDVVEGFKEHNTGNINSATLIKCLTHSLDNDKEPAYVASGDQPFES